MSQGFYRQIAAELQRLGYAQKAGGKHQKWCKDDYPTIIVPHNLRSKFTANAILRDAGSDKRV